MEEGIRTKIAGLTGPLDRNGSSILRSADDYLAIAEPLLARIPNGDDVLSVSEWTLQRTGLCAADSSTSRVLPSLASASPHFVELTRPAVDP